MTEVHQAVRATQLVPSSEQAAIVERACAGDSLRILALAGTGKSTTLEFICNALGDKRILYLVFNKAQSIVAEARFAHLPRVRPMTFHRLAYAAVGHVYAHRLARHESESDRRWMQFLAERGALNDFSAGDHARAARAIIATIKRFYATADRKIDESHVPQINLDREMLAGLARRMWRSLETDESLPITHDWYFKKYQLSNPRLAYEVTLADEAQDLNPAATALLETQTHAQRIYVGDPNQTLYRFRGAENALGELDLPSMPLTETRRFGPNIAAAANAILEAKGETLRIRGIGPDPGLVRPGYAEKSNAVLSRSNAGLVGRALALIENDERIFIRGGTDPTTGRAGSGAGELMSALLAAYKLWSGKPDDHHLFASFSNWEEVRKAAEDDGGEGLRPYVRLVEDHRNGVPRVVQLIRENSCKTEADADVVLSTTHRYKGEEADIISLGDDFHDFVDENDVLDEDEANIAYVAATRAKRELHYGGAYGTLRDSLDRRDLRIPITSVERPFIAATRSTPRPPAAPPAKRPEPTARSYRKLVPGSMWQHPIHGIVTIADATQNAVDVVDAGGERRHLATMLAYDRLLPVVPAATTGE
jgi:hypothetical protein